jgi:hypothetical protein
MFTSSKKKSDLATSNSLPESQNTPYENPNTLKKGNTEVSMRKVTDTSQVALDQQNSSGGEYNRRDGDKRYNKYGPRRDNREGGETNFNKQ